MKPIVIDLYCGLGGWSEGFLAEGYDCQGYDIEAHDYGSGCYPGTLHIRDVRSIHGSEFKDAACIVGSSPCQEFSYRAMPWSRAKALPPPYLGMELFDAQFRIQREACEAAGRHIPMVVENVRGAQKWVGRAPYHYGSFYLWGDIPALMPSPMRSPQSLHANEGRKTPSGNASSPLWKEREIARYSHPTPEEMEANGLGVKQPGISGVRENGKGDKWFQDGAARHGSKSDSRKAASAMIAKIPFPLANHIARTFKPQENL